MSETKHTPGPWEYRSLYEWDKAVVTRHGELPDGSPCRWTIATCNTKRDEAEANAKLIAAAPDLLAIVNELLKLADEHQRGGHNIFQVMTSCPLIDAARAAIAKAQGYAHD